MKNINNRLKEAFSSQSRYCYPDTDVLINKLNITNQEDLDKAEASITLLRLSNLQLNGIPSEFDFTVDYYLKIHKIIFSDLYDFAGEIRNENIVKSNPFCRPEFIYNYLKTLLEEMKIKIRNINDYDKLIQFLAYYYSEINIVHPFREGNGRILREFLREVVVYINKVNNLNYELDYSLINEEEKELLLNGSILSAVTGDTNLLERFFQSVLVSNEKEIGKQK